MLSLKPFIIGYVVSSSALENCVAMKANPTPGDDIVVGSSPNMHLEIGYEFWGYGICAHAEGLLIV